MPPDGHGTEGGARQYLAEAVLQIGGMDGFHAGKYMLI